MQSLKRQLAESRDSLEFSNKTCEQLEVKVEELERTHTRLQQQMLSQQSSLDHKTKQIESLEEELAETRAHNERLRERTTRLVADKNELKQTTGTEDARMRERSKSCHGNVDVSMETDGIVSELTERVQNLTFQKEKAERELSGLVTENETLSKTLERAEADIEELTSRVAACEEILERQGTPLSTPKHSHATPSHFELPGDTEDHTPQPPDREETPEANGQSLFNELDNEYSSLRHHYNTLVQGCTCSASLHHKSWTSGGGVANEGVVKEGKSNEKPFKELFEDLFATLKQTAHVADRLIERKKGAEE